MRSSNKRRKTEKGEDKKEMQEHGRRMYLYSWLSSKSGRLSSHVEKVFISCNQMKNLTKWMNKFKHKSENKKTPI